MDTFKGTITVTITDVNWDTDGDKKLKETLPKTIVHTFTDCDFDDGEEFAEMVSDWLSDEFGFCHFGFTIVEMD